MKSPFNEVSFQKRLLWVNGSIPLLLLAYDLYFDRLGANPPEAVIRTTGVIAIIFLALTLLVTPLSKMLGASWMVKHRRWLGLWCFYYALIHLLAYSIFDKALGFGEIFKDIAKRPFILLGFLGFLLLVPLAITSSNQMIQRMGGLNWKRLHRLTYVIPPLVVLHYWLIVKSDLFYPKVFLSVFALLLGYRLVGFLRKNRGV